MDAYLQIRRCAWRLRSIVYNIDDGRLEDRRSKSRRQDGRTENGEEEVVGR